MKVYNILTVELLAFNTLMYNRHGALVREPNIYILLQWLLCLVTTIAGQCHGSHMSKGIGNSQGYGITLIRKVVHYMDFDIIGT